MIVLAKPSLMKALQLSSSAVIGSMFRWGFRIINWNHFKI